MILSANTHIECADKRRAVLNAVAILERDIKKRFHSPSCDAAKISLIACDDFADEDFRIEIRDDGAVIYANGELGFVYGLLYISEKFLGIKPFWFWMDQRIEKTDSIPVKNGVYSSPVPAVKYRGWFVNDEVLIMKWAIDGDSKEPWRMVFEALLRCGGNTVIPGTDKNSRLYNRMASDMGLWITHHHAEPMGAEMFGRKYPDLEANYFEYKDKFHELWRDAVREQKDMKVIWSVGFRGQGDCPFWANDTSSRYDTDQKRGALISDIIELQRQIVLESVEDPVFCTNLYGEVMELYDGGYINFDENIIKVSADNGFGKMVTRRRNNHTVRVPSIPKEPTNHGGIYYHVSFYDLQAANHITMLPNSVDFVNSELDTVMAMNMNDFWVINCSNIRPHAYFLDAVRKKWYGRSISDAAHSAEWANDYYNGAEGVAMCLGDYFYTENVRMLARMAMIGKSECCGVMRWFTGDIPLDEQIEKFSSMCERGLEKLRVYYEECEKVSSELIGDTKELFDATILLQAKIHYYCCKGAALFGKAYREYTDKKFFSSFMLFGDSAAMYEDANKAMRGSEYGVWSGFYFNECFADCKHSAYMINKLRGVVREMGDNISHYKWYRDLMYTRRDRSIMTLLVNDNHMEDQEIYEKAKKLMGDGPYALPID